MLRISVRKLLLRFICTRVVLFASNFTASYLLHVRVNWRATLYNFLSLDAKAIKPVSNYRSARSYHLFSTSTTKKHFKKFNFFLKKYQFLATINEFQNYINLSKLINVFYKKIDFKQMNWITKCYEFSGEHVALNMRQQETTETLGLVQTEAGMNSYWLEHCCLLTESDWK